jgi:signal transduction histidine kinase/CheY-like chemotaxis protein
MDKNKPGSTETKLWREVSGPLLTLGVAAVIELLSRTAFKIPNPPAFLLLMVVFSGFRAGLRSGLTSAAAAWVYFAYYFSLPQQPFHYTDENLRRVLVWLVTTPAIALMVGIQRRHIERMSEALYHGLFKGSLRRYTERLKILHQIDQGILAAQSPEDIADAALREIWQLIPYRRATVAVLDFAAKEYRVLATHPRGSNPIAPGTRLPLESLGDIDRTLEVLRQGRVHRLELRSLAAPSPVIQAVLAEGILEMRVVPLLVQGELIGSISFGEESALTLTPEHIEIAREVADQLAVAIQQTRLREGLRQHAADLERRVADRTVELEKARHAADHANQAKSEFLSRMSHELRTPLNAVLGFAQLLQMDALSEEQRESVGHIDKGGRHLLGLINEVLDIARIEAGRLAISLEPVPVQRLVQESLDLIAPLAAAEHVQLEGSLPDTREYHVQADRQRLKQVLLNLLSNAVKYNRQGGAVTLSYDETPTARLRINVTDTGPGIAPEKMERLFTPFDRLDVDQTGVEGSGLGLALSKRLVEAMGGALGVESSVGRGSTFWVELPLVEDWVKRLDGGEGAPAPARSDALRKARVVLYVEDNLSNLKLIERVVAHRPEVRILPAMQGRLGLDLAREHSPDLILLDLHLPDMPGEEFLLRLRAMPETREIPVVVISADATPGQADRLLASGARGYLAKPVEVKKFLALLDEVSQEGEWDHARGPLPARGQA